MTTKVCLAVDLGAGSGRVLAGIYDGDTLSLKELNRFTSAAIKNSDGWHWDFDKLLASIKEGIAIAVKEYGDQVVSLGADTWGVDYGLIDANGKLLVKPFQYRDSRTNKMMELAYSRMPKDEIYRRTGIQFMFFNTIYQLLAELNSPARLLDKAERILLMPDLINYMLTGKQLNERTVASTGQLLDAKTQSWDRELLSAMGFPEKIFGELVDAGTKIGSLLPEVQKEVGATRLQVIAPGCHDTASAVAGAPANEEEPVFLSSGTWSLMGRELKAPRLTQECFEAAFSNETGVCGTTRFLKNIAGMWLLQESKRKWDLDEELIKANGGQKLTYDQIAQQAGNAQPFVSLINPDSADFQAPEDMPAAIRNYCKQTNQPEPITIGQMTRCIIESLALKYRMVKNSLVKVTGKPINKIYIVGGGSQNELLNQFAADATNCEISAGPVEATSIGNILMQLISLGELKSLSEGRALVRRSFEMKSYKPQNTAVWDEAAVKFEKLVR